MAARSVRHAQDLASSTEEREESDRKRDGTEILAEVALRIVRERVLDDVRREFSNGADGFCLLPFYS